SVLLGLRQRVRGGLGLVVQLIEGILGSLAHFGVVGLLGQAFQVVMVGLRLPLQLLQGLLGGLTLGGIFRFLCGAAQLVVGVLGRGLVFQLFLQIVHVLGGCGARIRLVGPILARARLVGVFFVARAVLCTGVRSFTCLLFGGLIILRLATGVRVFA